MATLDNRVEEPAYRRDSEQIGREIADIATGFAQTVHVAGLKNDPVYPVLDVMFSSLKLQWKLHDQAVRYFHDVTDRLDRAYLDTVRKADLALKQAEVTLQTKQGVIIEQLVPRHAAMVTDSVRHYWRIVKYRTIAWSSIGVLLVALFPCGLTYTAGLSAGRAEGEMAAHTIQAAMAAGPNAANTWALLMADNDPVKAMANCRNGIQTDADGRRFCMLPVWIDPINAPATRN